jgi:predicted  nucleic acid-binding Zn-ribbon protein
MLEVTKDEMDVLIRLQANEDDKNKINSLLKKIPGQMAVLDKQLAEEEQKMRDREALWENQKKQYRDCEAEIKQRQESIKKSDLKLMSIKSNKEY